MRVTERLFRLFVPPAIGVFMVLLFYLLLPYDYFFSVAGAMFLYFVPPAGKESMVPTVVVLLKEAYGIWSIPIATLAIGYIDGMVALFLYWNWDLIQSIPVIGPALKRFEESMRRKMKKREWVRRLGYVGIVLFVAFPFQGSGGVGGTIMGHMLGLNPRRVLYAITIGAFLGCFLIAVISYYAYEATTNILSGKNPIWTVLSLVLITVVVVTIWMIYRRKSP